MLYMLPFILNNLNYNRVCIHAGDQMLILLGKISTTINMTEMTHRSRQPTTVREHQKSGYMVEGKHVCRATFKFLHAYVLLTDHCSSHK